ncbi:histidine kinase [Dactylosporangium darangshiense]|uniref:histidine kinase n=1 Tax=Dactylosporangium darangshiense TaxID=579108 RepID=A0ABP8CWI7_9ACTN
MATALLTRRLRPVDLYAIDVVVASLVALLCVTAADATPQSGGPHEPIWLSVSTGLVIGLPVAVRRRWPYTVAIIVSIASTLALLTAIIPTFASLAPACALALVSYSLGTAARDWNGGGTAFGCAALVSFGMAWPTFLHPQEAPPSDPYVSLLSVLLGLLFVVPAYAIGYSVGERRHQSHQLSDQLVRQAAVEERLRVARELHDIVAHTMTLIVVKASIGNHVAEADPAEARDALRVIETTGRSAMFEVRRVLDMLREDTPYAPTPGLGDLSHLAEQATVGGVEVQLEVEHPERAATREPHRLAAALEPDGDHGTTGTADSNGDHGTTGTADRNGDHGMTGTADSDGDTAEISALHRQRARPDMSAAGEECEQPIVERPLNEQTLSSAANDERRAGETGNRHATDRAAVDQTTGAGDKETVDQPRNGSNEHAAGSTGDTGDGHTMGLPGSAGDERTAGVTGGTGNERIVGQAGSAGDELGAGKARGGKDLRAVGHAGDVWDERGACGRAEVSEAVGLAVYRIVQEALTNVVKHAAPAKCRVRVVVGRDEVRVEVTDDGSRSVRVNGIGHGLIGMRERVAMHGGTFSAGPREGGGFGVTARLPVGSPT